MNSGHQHRVQDIEDLKVNLRRMSLRIGHSAVLHGGLASMNPPAAAAAGGSPSLYIPTPHQSPDPPLASLPALQALGRGHKVCPYYTARKWAEVSAADWQRSAGQLWLATHAGCLGSCNTQGGLHRPAAAPFHYRDVGFPHLCIIVRCYCRRQRSSLRPTPTCWTQ